MLKKEDYEEPVCILNMKPNIARIPTGRILEKLDSFLNKNDYESGEKLLSYWLQEAEQGADLRGQLTIFNEQIGLFRKTAQKDKCLSAIESALNLSEKLEGTTASRGTTLVNAATGCKAFGYTERAMELYEQALTVYEERLKSDDARLGALYNNMAVTLAGEGDYIRARELYGKASAVMSKQKRGGLELAVTNLNLADLITMEKGPEEGESEINSLLDKAEELLDSDSCHDGYYAFICEKCAPCFAYYGRFFTEKKLLRIAKEIYEGT